MTEFEDHTVHSLVQDRNIVLRALNNRGQEEGGIHIIINGPGVFANAVMNLGQAQDLLAALQATIEEATPSTPALIAKKIISLTKEAFKARNLTGPGSLQRALGEIVDLCQELEELDVSLEELDVSPARTSDDERVEAYLRIKRLLATAPSNLNTLASVRTVVDRVGS